jgi:hypothetical protein
MFFRRERHKDPSPEERLEAARRAGFTVTPIEGGGVEISRGDIVRRESTGVRMGNEIGYLVDGGYQKFFRTPSGRQRPALARNLQELHDFEEDLREALGQESLYNESLGTVSTYYLYDRVKDRDRGVPKRAWEE